MRYCLVDTALGTIGLAWSEKGLRRVLLPDVSRQAIEDRLLRVAEPAKVPQQPRFLMDAIETYAEGRPVDFSATIVDIEHLPEFDRTVYADIRELGWGETTTYGEIAERLGDIRIARAVGQALGRNPVPLIIPCHRVLAAGNRIGGFSAPGGSAAKLGMLTLEGVRLRPPDPPQLSFAF
jgi:methylated-DNA-[protein]-cysteine S-methyltransferase